MEPSGTATPGLVESFFQFSIVGLVASGFVALAGSGHLDLTTLVLASAGLLIRAAMVTGWIRLRLATSVVATIAIGYIGLYALDAFVISRDAFTATVHGVCFIALLKIITAESNRDYIYVGIIAFLELLAAAVLSFKASFFAYLALFVFFAIAAFTSAEIRGSAGCFTSSAPPPGIRFTWRLAALTCAAAVFTLFITAGLFLVVPRTARAAAMWLPASRGLTGFSDKIDLGRFGDIAKDDRPVMHIRPYSHALPPDLKWRGNALSNFDGKRWTEPPSDVMSHEVRRTIVVADRWQRSRRDGSRFMYRVDIDDSDTGTLFIAGIPEFLNVDAPRISLTPDDSFRVPPTPGEPLHYEVSAHSGPPLAYPLSRSERWRYLALPPIDGRIRLLARQWAGDGTDALQAFRIQNHLRTEFKYTLESPNYPPRDPLANFLFVRKAGYCEFFASAMAVMLRTLGIPSRVATGFQSGYFNDISGQYVIRASDAHAWVEAWLDGRGWTTFDPTPPSASSSPGLFARLDMYLDAADSQWQQWVMSYDFMHQLQLASRLQNLLRGWKSAGALGTTPWTARDLRKGFTWAKRGFVFAVFMGLLIIFGPRLWRDWRRQARIRQIGQTGGAPGDARLLYERMLDLLARRGYHKPAWFTPMEFATGLPPEISGEVLRFTSLYNASRFGGDVSLNTRLAALLESISGLTAN